MPIGHDQIYRVFLEQGKHFDMHQSIGVVLDLLDLADHDVESLDDELTLLGKHLHKAGLAENQKPEQPVIVNGEWFDTVYARLQQLQGVLLALLANDQLKSLNPDYVMNAVWAVSEQVNQAKAACDKYLDGA